MTLAFVPAVSMIFAPIEPLQFEFFFEFSWAPEIIFPKDGTGKLFQFSRVSPGVNTLFHVPLKNGTRSIFFGPGIEYDSMKFEQYRAGTVGVRGKLGIRFYERDLVSDFFTCILVTHADSLPIKSERLSLNYTSFLIGATAYWGL
ncbi:MAG: hypothetical protein JXX29_23610 [Deltaproteobacteria bacterium]|nr:hypothetical protein [Deltaproteobacteria bacterium]MBN2674688.1 hypothetical protein [Deltaproteobacteria bacterium]